MGKMTKYILGWYRKELVELEATTKVTLFKLIVDWWKNGRCVKNSKILESWEWHETELELTNEDAMHMAKNLYRVYMPIMRAGGGQTHCVSLVHCGVHVVYTSCEASHPDAFTMLGGGKNDK